MDTMYPRTRAPEERNVSANGREANLRFAPLERGEVANSINIPLWGTATNNVRLLPS
jgi:hypothetical protein